MIRLSRAPPIFADVILIEISNKMYIHLKYARIACRHRCARNMKKKHIGGASTQKLSHTGVPKQYKQKLHIDLSKLQNDDTSVAI